MRALKPEIILFAGGLLAGSILTLGFVAGWVAGEGVEARR